MYDNTKTNSNSLPMLYGVISYKKSEELRKRLEELYNSLGIDSELGIHDFILADYTINNLVNLGNLKKKECNLKEGGTK